MNEKESQIKNAAFEGLDRASNILTRNGNASTYDDVMRAARSAEAAAADLHKLAGYMLWRKESELDASAQASLMSKLPRLRNKFGDSR